LKGGAPPSGGQPRGLALAAALPGDITLVAALTGDGPSGIALEVVAAGAGSFGPVTIPLRRRLVCGYHRFSGRGRAAAIRLRRAAARTRRGRAGKRDLQR
jgi:hypothetical protein